VARLTTAQGATTTLQPGHSVESKAWPMRTLLFRYQIAVCHGVGAKAVALQLPLLLQLPSA
jgi:hypothetical protein